MSFFKKLIRRKAPATKAGSGLLKNNEDVQNTHSDSPTDEVFSTVGDYGLQTLSDNTDDIIDIVFVHGLTGNSKSTWTHKTAQVFWPKDLLSKDLPKARVITFGYDADIIRGLSTVGNGTLRDHGKALAEDLAIRRKETDSNLRPLIFVAHSLGGLVVEQALLVSRGSAQQHTKDLLESTVAIAFMGTPHLGSNLANWGFPILKLSNLLRKSNSDIVGVLQPGSEMLAAVQQEFHTMLDDRSRNDNKYINIYCFYEEVAYPGLGEIVPKQSAILTAYSNNGIHATHTGMTKFKTANDTGYIRVRGQLWLWYNNVEESQDAWKEKKAAAKKQQQRHLQSASVTESNRGETSHSGPVHHGSGDNNGIFAPGGTMTVNKAQKDFHQHQHYGNTVLTYNSHPPPVELGRLGLSSQPILPNVIRGAGSYAQVKIGVGLLGHFQGRTKILSKLEASLLTSGVVDYTRVIVLWGQAGSGKSTICNKFYAQNQNHYWAAWRLNAETIASIETDFQSIATEYGLQTKDNDMLEVVIKWFQNLQGHWLLVFENADEKTPFLKKYIPSSRFGTVLITTRHKHIADIPTVEECEVPPLDKTESVALLLSMWGNVSENPASDPILLQDVAGTIAERVSHLPMALMLIMQMVLKDGHETRRRSTRLGDWLRTFDEKPQPHLKHGALELWTSVYKATIDAMFKRAKMANTEEDVLAETQKVQDAVELLYFLCLLSSSSVSLELFRKIANNRHRYTSVSPRSLASPGQNHEQLSNTPRHSLSKEYVLNVLGNAYDLIDIERIEQGISLLQDNCLADIVLSTTWCVSPKGLVRDCVRASIYSKGAKSGEYFALKTIVTLAQAIEKDYSVESKAFRRQLFPHIEASRLAFDEGDETIFVNSIFKKLGLRDGSDVILRFSLVYSESGKITTARLLQDRLIQLATTDGPDQLGITDEILLWAQAMLATSCHDLNGPGQKQEAIRLRELVVEGRKLNFEMTPASGRSSDEDQELHDAYLIALSNLADSYDELPSQVPRAIVYRRKILEIRESSPSTSDLSETKLRLARSYFQGGFKNESFQIRLSVDVERKRRVDGSVKILDELDLKALSDLAESHCDRGEWHLAYKERKTVLEGREALLGCDHHDTLAAKANLALSLTKLGNISEALKLRVDLYEKSRKIFSDDHITTLRYFLEVAKTIAKAPFAHAKLDAAEITEWCFFVFKDKIDRGDNEYHLGFLESAKAYARSLEKSISSSGENAEERFTKAMCLRDDILRDLQNQQPYDLDIAKAMNDKAECYAYYGRYEDAKEMRLQILHQFHDQLEKVLNEPSDVSSQQIYMKILEGLARDYTRLANDYRQTPDYDIEKSRTPGSTQENLLAPSNTTKSSIHSDSTQEYVQFSPELAANCLAYMRKARHWRETILSIYLGQHEPRSDLNYDTLKARINLAKDRSNLNYDSLKAIIYLAKVYATEEIGLEEEARELGKVALIELEKEDRLGKEHAETKALSEWLQGSGRVDEWLEGVREGPLETVVRDAFSDEIGLE